MKKKVLAWILTIAMLLGSCVPVYAEGIDGSDSPKAVETVDYDGLKFHFDVLADSVQAEGTDDASGNPIVLLAWGVDPASL